jgi:hypothetical protein
VLVGDSIDGELSSKILNGHVANGIPIAALTIKRFRSTKGNVYVTTDIYFKNSAATMDLTKYKFDGEELAKNRFVLKVMKRYVEDYPETTFADLTSTFPKRTQGSTGVFATEEEANEIFNRTGRKRHFVGPDELIALPDVTIAICNQWGVDNIDRFITIAQNLGYDIGR